MINAEMKENHAGIDGNNEELKELVVKTIETYNNADKTNKNVTIGIVGLGVFSLLIANYITRGTFIDVTFAEGLQSIMYLMGMPVISLMNLVIGIRSKIGYKTTKKQLIELLAQLDIPIENSNIELGNVKGK